MEERRAPIPAAVEHYKQELQQMAQRGPALHKPSLGDHVAGVGDAIERVGDFVSDAADSIGGAARKAVDLSGKISGAADMVSDIADVAHDAAQGAGRFVERAGERFEDFTERVGDAAEHAGAFIDKTLKRAEPILKKAEPYVKTGLAVAGAAAAGAAVAKGVEMGVEALEEHERHKHQAHHPQAVPVPLPAPYPPRETRPVPPPPPPRQPEPVLPHPPHSHHRPAKPVQPDPACPIHGKHAPQCCCHPAGRPQPHNACGRPACAPQKPMPRSAAPSSDLPEAPQVFAPSPREQEAFRQPSAAPVTQRRGAAHHSLPKVAYDHEEDYGNEQSLPGDARELTLPEFRSIDDYYRYNSAQGFLTVNVLTADAGMPVPGALVRVTRTVHGTPYLFQEVHTDRNGQALQIPLPAPPAQNSQHPPQGDSPYAHYDVTVSHNENSSQELVHVAVFAGTESVQVARLGLRPYARYDEAQYQY